MNKGNINITVSGGTADFGNVVQGDDNKISIATTKALQEFYSNISALQKNHEATKDQVDSLKKEIGLLTQGAENTDLVDRVKLIHEKYSWALKPLTNLFSVILP